MPHPNIVGKSSGILSADSTVKATPGKVHSVTIMWGTTAQNDIRLRDGGAGGATRFQAKRAAVAVAGDVTDHYIFPARIAFSTDIYFQIFAGTGPVVVVIYE